MSYGFTPTSDHLLRAIISPLSKPSLQSTPLKSKWFSHEGTLLTLESLLCITDILQTLSTRGINWVMYYQSWREAGTFSFLIDVVLSLLFGGVIPLSLTLTKWSGFKYLNWLLNGLIWNLDCVLIVPRGWNLMFLLTRHNCSIGSTVFLSVPQYLLKTPVQTKLTWRPFLSNDIVQYETALPPQKSNQWHLKNHYHFTTSCLISNWKANGGEQSVVRVGHISV